MINASVLAPWALLLPSLEGRFRGSPVPPVQCLLCGQALLDQEEGGRSGWA